jgi:hypothetical protein
MHVTMAFSNRPRLEAILLTKDAHSILPAPVKTPRHYFIINLTSETRILLIIANKYLNSSARTVQTSALEFKVTTIDPIMHKPKVRRIMDIFGPRIVVRLLLDM